MQKLATIINSPIGKLGIQIQDQHLTAIAFLPHNTSLKIPQTSFEKEVVKQLVSFFNKKYFVFDLPYSLSGTPFQKKVWQALQKISPGKTLSYGALAKQLKTSPRAIGQACRTNPLPIVIPCHRVVANQGLGGYSGAIKGSKLDIKLWLLTHEA